MRWNWRQPIYHLARAIVGKDKNYIRKTVCKDIKKAIELGYKTSESLDIKDTYCK